MKPVSNTVPPYEIVYPIGSRLKWTNENGTDCGDEITVKGYSRGCSECSDCDGIFYVDSTGQDRCHYRKSESRFGLRYWKRVD